MRLEKPSNQKKMLLKTSTLSLILFLFFVCVIEKWHISSLTHIHPSIECDIPLPDTIFLVFNFDLIVDQLD